MIAIVVTIAILIVGVTIPIVSIVGLLFGLTDPTSRMFIVEAQKLETQ